MQVVVIYSAKASVTNTLKQAILSYNNDKNTNLVVIATRSEHKQAEEWTSELQHKFGEVAIHSYNSPSAIGDSDMEQLHQRFYPRLRAYPIDEESIYLHPFDVPAQDFWDTQFRDMIRLSKKLIIGQGIKDDSGAYVLNRSFIYSRQFQEFSRSGRMYSRNGNVFKSIGWEVKQVGDIIDSIPFLQPASSFKVKTESPIVKKEAKVSTTEGEDAVGAAFDKLSEAIQPEEKVTEEVKPAKKKAAKKAAKRAKKKSAKKAAKKKVAKVVETPQESAEDKQD